ncbi:MAG: FKBP-type peptidyl-prolyl cis-trans isomerase [Chitinophaga sp.]|uniref:FKBP-type peptidyl-prolyl cis-trans isomerase n=1 Tax=Chitinophaga sp. TaxID=1869181 RepID=UPI0025BCF403|nr:FKBP-type peptidyl-prolyl cis-trans isomerase [Chitinophaga sp.]MBV8252510.1 FKBP-type peptidyl-prolyl cis-trans isomerase [Chitinophaga sp.]
MKKFLFLGIACLALLAACKKNDTPPPYDPYPQFVIDSTKIQAYLKANNITDAKMDASGVFYQISKQGTGTDSLKLTSYPTVGYAGYLMNGTTLGTKFDSSDSTNFSFQYQMRDLIPGWYAGMKYLRKGGQMRMYIPSVWGYGTRGMSTIPANSVLIFDVKLIDFTSGN